MANYRLRKGVRYYKDYNAARKIRDQIIANWPNARIVNYEIGWAVQYYISGPYYPELENTMATRKSNPARKKAASKTAARSKKKSAARSPAQKRATARLVAMNKKKAAAKKRPARRKVRSRARTRPRASVYTSGGAPVTGRKRNPVTKALIGGPVRKRYAVVFVEGAEKYYLTGFTKEGGFTLYPSASTVTLFSLGAAQTTAYALRSKLEEKGKQGHIELMMFNAQMEFVKYIQ